MVCLFRPTLVHSDHVKRLDESEICSETDSNWTLMPMRWGLIPSWHTGDIQNVSWKMNNARSDTIMEKRTFRVPLDKGYRCAIVMEG